MDFSSIIRTKPIPIGAHIYSDRVLHSHIISKLLAAKLYLRIIDDMSLIRTHSFFIQLNSSYHKRSMLVRTMYRDIAIKLFFWLTNIKVRKSLDEGSLIGILNKTKQSLPIFNNTHEPRHNPANKLRNKYVINTPKSGFGSWEFASFLPPMLINKIHVHYTCLMGKYFAWKSL